MAVYQDPELGFPLTPARVTDRDHDAILREARELLHQRFGIDHCTVQLEGAGLPLEEGCGQGDCP